MPDAIDKSSRVNALIRNVSVVALAAPNLPETITIPAGAAGTLKNFSLKVHSIANAAGTDVGGAGDTSIVLTSNTAFTTEVAPKDDADLANGEYYINYLTGKGRGRKADTSTSMTATTYNVFTLQMGLSSTGQPLPNVDPTANGTLKGIAAATQMPSVAAKMVKFKTLPGNAGNFYFGPASGLTVPTLGAANNTTGGFPMSPDSDSGWIILKSGNLNQLYFMSDNTNDVMSYLIEA